MADAHRALVESNWQPNASHPMPGPSWAWGHMLRTDYQTQFVSGLSRIDLHWRLDPTKRALPDFAQASERHVTIDLQGCRSSLGPGDTFAHTSSHAAKDDWRWLRSLVDVHRLSRSPDLWAAEPVLRKIDVATLAVTRIAIGLPASVPEQALSLLPPDGGWAARVAK